MPDNQDVWLPRLGLLMIGLIGIVAAVSCGVIIARGQPIPCELSNIGVGAASTLGTVLTAIIGMRNGHKEEG